MKIHWPQVRRRIVQVILLFFMSTVGAVLFYSVVPVAITPLMVIRSVSSLWGDNWVGIEKDWVPLEEISPHIQRAVLKAEDYKFFEHGGFDYEAIRKAFAYNKKHRTKKGASTISQQTAKNVFLWPQRDWVRKGLEAYFTILIEVIWSKERILEVYLNVIELGHGVYGVEAASQKYFKRSAKNVNSHQASLLAAVLPNPRKFRVDRPSIYVMARQQRILRRVAPDIPKYESLSLKEILDFKFDSEDDVN